MRTLFIADLHLSEQEPAITAGFLRFLQREAYQADALYILGDFSNTGLATTIRNRCIVKSALRCTILPIQAFPVISSTVTVTF